MENEIIKSESETVITDSTSQYILSSILRSLDGVRQDEWLTSSSDKVIARDIVVSSMDFVLMKAKQLGYALTLKNGRVYIFNGQYWKGIEIDAINSFLGQAAEKIGVTPSLARYHAFRNDLYRQFTSSSFFSVPEKSIIETKINLLNGTFRIDGQLTQLTPFDSTDFLTYQLAFEFNPIAECPLFKKFLNEVLPDIEQQMVLAEFIGYVFIKHRTLKLEKVMILFGLGGNGKSVVFDVFSDLLGSENVSNYSLQSLTNESGYSRAMLTDKLLNYSPEISSQMNTTTFKQLASGEKIEASILTI